MVAKNGCKVKENKEVIKMLKIMLAGLTLMMGFLLLAEPSSAAEATFGQQQFVNLLQWNGHQSTEWIRGEKSLPDILGGHAEDWREHMVPLSQGTR